jgi:DNA-binding FadR family transcriptional regulator
MTDTTVTGLFTPANTRRRGSVTEQIKNYILLNRLHPGDLLPTEAELCTALGVSRSSVREAMRTLAALDIVEVRHGHGTYVGQLSLAPLVEGLVFRGVLGPDNDFSALREVIEVREALDSAVAEHIIEAFSAASDPKLEALVAAMEDKSSRNEPFAEEDLAFHTQLLSHIDNGLIGQLVAAFWEINTVVYPKLGLAPATDLDETAKAHGLMLRAAVAGDVEAYREAVVLHYKPLRRALEVAELK